jgi:nucleotidyltransferase substrate binding protein (TIGR01987 family)
MEGKFINRYRSFCQSLEGLEKAKNRNPEDEFVLSGTVQKFNLTFDISWKVMKDILVNYHKIQSFATGSPRETLRTAKSVDLIEDDIWLDMLDDRNDLAHDYDGQLAMESFEKIVNVYVVLFKEFKEKAQYYINLMREM